MNLEENQGKYKYRCVDWENSDIVAEGYAKNSAEFHKINKKKINEYALECEGDWMPVTQILVNGKWKVVGMERGV